MRASYLFTVLLAAERCVAAGPANTPSDRLLNTKGIIPVPCHSHNDYWREDPLLEAIELGCTSVEADVRLKDRELYVAHKKEEIRKDLTLKKLYINPLVKNLDNRNPNNKQKKQKKPKKRNKKNKPNQPIIKQSGIHGLFDENPEQTLMLLIDLKSKGDTWKYVNKHIGPLRDRGYLTYLDGDEIISGPVIVVVTGKQLLKKVLENKFQDIFFDAELAGMGQEKKEKKKKKNKEYHWSNSFLASTNFGISVGNFTTIDEFTEKHVEQMEQDIKAARDLGMKVRYWNTPVRPDNLRLHVRTVLSGKVDYLNEDRFIEEAAFFLANKDKPDARFRWAHRQLPGKLWGSSARDGH